MAFSFSSCVPAYETAPNLSVPHGFTTRLGGVSEGVFQSLNLAMHRGDDPEHVAKNWGILADSLGFDLKNLILTHQVHSDVVRRVTRADAMGLDHHRYPECDALITDQPGTALMVFTADCTPILLWDRVNGAVGAVHAGWRGTAADIAGKTVRAMVNAYGCDPANIHAAIGPNIDFCCFQTDDDVPRAMIEAFGSDALVSIRPAENKFYVNLKEINALALRRVGVENIFCSESCTVCQSNRFWSHRVTRGQRGSQGAIIVCKGEIA